MTKKKDRINPHIKTVISIVLLVAFWWMMSVILTESVLPSPWVTVRYMYEDFISGELMPQIGITLFRVLKAFIFTMVIGIAAGCILGLSRTAGLLFDNWIVIGQSVPPLVLIIVVFLGMGLSEVSAVVAAVLTTVFTIIQNIEQGVRAIDRDLIEMGYSLKANKRLMLQKIILPQIYPYIMASARFGLSLTWKMVIFVEQMGRSNGVGFSINHWYQMYNMGHVLSYSLAFILVMLIIEMILGKIVEPLLFRWQR